MPDVQDDATDLQSLYADHRKGAQNPVAHSGYVSQRLFLKEQRWVVQQAQQALETLQTKDKVWVLDGGCGYGVMTAPLSHSAHLLGIDFDHHALTMARNQGLLVSQADQFTLPLRNESVEVVICTQFLNQQNQIATARLLKELVRVLTPCGHLIMTWRKDGATVHRVAQWGLKLFGSPFASFPQYRHDWDEVRDQCVQMGLSVVNAGVMPVFSSKVRSVGSWQHFGTSYVAHFAGTQR